MLQVKCNEEWDKDFPAGIRVTVQDDEQYFILQIPDESLNKSVKACEEEMLRQMEMMFSGEYIFDGTCIYKKSHPERKVWEILDKGKWMEEGQARIENLYMSIQRICKLADKKDIDILCDGIVQNTYEVAHIIDDYLK